MKHPPIIEIKKLTKIFGPVTAVRCISFSLEKGKITGLLGPNGAGKTTTIQMILDLITPTSGEIRIFGKKIKTHREEILNRINFSSAYIMLPYNLKVRESLLTFARLYGLKNPAKRVSELAEFFGITEFLPKMTSSLSTGQLTRVHLAKALLNNPDVLLLDEPTSSLDPDIADKMRKLLLEIKKEHGTTILYTSHNMAEVEEMCDRVIFMNKGTITDDGTPEQLIEKYGKKDMNDVFLAIARGE